ncbi:hypothetical protein PoB_001451000 [Plakobranchus ocellatus]|uniref:Uncharacterized protein n=1 Tax=Plakobranchus ocellatus TaxID=259542 RepID=A0AAV3YYM6_9GAST|nr:hypothetical protein PoB_001451000 [Plakobranchus ocellatus]
MIIDISVCCFKILRVDTLVVVMGELEKPVLDSTPSKSSCLTAVITIFPLSNTITAWRGSRNFPQSSTLFYINNKKKNNNNNNNTNQQQPNRRDHNNSSSVNN